MPGHTRLRGNKPLPRLGTFVKGWGDPFVWSPSPLDVSQPPPCLVGTRANEFEWPGKFPPSEDHPWLALVNLRV
jgi:hypothetical protein